MFLNARSRGQTLPIWSMGIAATLVLAFAAMQYGEVLRWQVRAQSAADAAATAALSAQTQTWNQQLALVYAASIEEWRIRNLLNGLTAAAYNDPGCSASGCQATYNALKAEYMRAVQRYTNDVQLINRTSQYTQSQAQSDATALVQQLQQKCGTAGGGDCAFSYNVVRVQPRVASVNTVEQDGGGWVINDPGVPAVVKADYTPAQIEIVACAKVAPLVPSFLNFQVPTFTAIGRAAATSAMVTQEWLQPGHTVNPRTGKPFQPTERYGPPATATGPNGWNWFEVDYDGNKSTAYPVPWNAYSTRIDRPEFSAVTGWWNSVPIKPFSGALDVATLACNAA